METKINIEKMHLIVLAVAISLVMGGILFSSYAAPIGFVVGHGADEIIVSIEGSDMSLADAISSGAIIQSSISGDFSYGACHNVTVDLIRDSIVDVFCEDGEVISSLETQTTALGGYGDTGEYHIPKIECCELIFS